jgi:hypothetical protein
MGINEDVQTEADALRHQDLVLLSDTHQAAVAGQLTWISLLGTMWTASTTVGPSGASIRISDTYIVYSITLAS